MLATPKLSSQPDDPFPNKDADGCVNILVRHGFGVSRLSRGDGDSSALFEILAEDEKASSVATSLIHREVRTETLSLPGILLLDIVANAWRYQAHERADAFVFHLKMNNLDSYLPNSEYNRRMSWEADRFEFSRLLCKPSLMEHPEKPFLLLVNYDLW